MAVNAKPPNHHPFLPPIPIDMSSLTHSELHSLSLLTTPTTTTTTPTTPPTTTTTTTSKFFINPSLSTHQQTYSLSPHPRRHLLNQERYESNMIVSLLKNHLSFDDFTPPPPPQENDGVEIVNRNGVVVDLAALEETENDGGPFAEELRRRAEGKVKQEELLEVLSAMEGEWCSRRKKRRVVDASSLGDALPVGWKIIVALRRKDGHFYPYCRRYISPTGEHLVSCKEVSSYLQSYFGINDAKLVRDSRVESQQLQLVEYVNHTSSISCENGNSMLDHSNSPIHSACVPIEHEEASILGIENLPDVRVCDLYECHSCNLSFDVKDKYLEHMFSLHQSTTKRYTLDSSVEDKVVIKDGKSDSQKKKKRRKLGLSVSDGVIMKDGKYGCQFCDKVFEERRRYLGHVGNHIKGSIKTPKELLAQVNGLAGAPCMEMSPTVISNSRTDSLIEFAQSSIQDINAPVFEKEPSSVNNVDRLSVADNSQMTKRNSSFCQNKLNAGIHLREGKTFSGELSPCKMVSGMSRACRNESVGEKSFEEGKISSEEFHPPCNNMNEMLLTDANVDHLDPSPREHGEDIGEDQISSLALNALGKMGEIMNTDGIMNVPACLDGHELEKAVRDDKSLAIANMSKMSTSDGERRWQSSIRNIVDSKNSCSEMMKTPAIKSAIAENVSETITTLAANSGIARNVSGNGKCNCIGADDKGFTDKLVGVSNIHLLCCNEKASDLDSAGKKIQLEYVHNPEPGHVQKYDDTELVSVSGKNYVSESAVPQLPLNSSSTFDEIFEKAGQDICSLDQNLESVTGLDYLKLDVIEPQMYKYNAMSREDSISFYEVSMDLGNNIGLGLGLDNSLKSQSEFPQEMARCMTTTVCVWCGVEFSHEVSSIEPQPDSVGFMCPACRAKISKQFNELESNFSLSSHCYN